MFSLEAITDRIVQSLEGHWVVKDGRLKPDLVRDEIIKIRAALLKEMSLQGTLDDMYQQRCCVEVRCEQVCDSPVKEFRATIPETITGGLVYVGSPDGKNAFLASDGMLYVPYTRFLKKRTTYRVLNITTLILDEIPHGLKKIMVQGIFANPYDCECLDTDRFVPAELLPEITKRVELNLANFLIERKVDKRNNQNPDV